MRWASTSPTRAEKVDSGARAQACEEALVTESQPRPAGERSTSRTNLRFLDHPHGANALRLRLRAFAWLHSAFAKKAGPLSPKCILFQSHSGHCYRRVSSPDAFATMR